MTEMSLGVVRSLGVGRFLEWGALDARGAAGGVVVFWDKRVLELMGMEVGLFSISCRFKNVEDGFRWTFSGVFPNERRRGGRVSSSMRRFSEVIDELELRDLPLQGGPFTWSGGVRRGPVPFRFENMWLQEEGFKELLGGWWQGVNKKLALDKVDFWDNQEKGRVLSMEELEARKEAKGNFEKWVLMEKISWRQKSKEVWLKEGDKNTGFFHKMTNSHRRKNCLSKIKVNGTWLTEEQEIKRRVGVVRAFKNLLTDHGEWHPSMDGLAFNRIDGEEAARLEEAFTEEEVFSALSDMNGDKAPGPDGFSLSFWQFSWEFVKVEVMGFFKEFHERGRFVRSLNSTFLVLIPKKAGAEDLRDFRPITQNAFVEGRQILDAALIANEAIDSMLKRKESGVLCKLDIEKAYDHLNWNFLLSILQRMGFGEKWTGWISWCISTATFSMLINGTPEGFFNSSRGCRIKGRRGDGALVSHLLFADDTLVFCDTSQDQMAYLSWLLMWFEAISGLRINLDKSEILPVGRVENLELLAHEVGCKVGRLPTSYLGIPLGANHKSVAVWDGVEERFRKRLAKWKRQFISKGGKMILIRSTLSSMPIYLMSLLRIPRVEEEEEEGGWYSKEVREGFGVGFWKDIRKEGALLQQKVGFSVGNGRRVKFWKDNWCGNSTLCNSFPSLYAFATYKEAWIEEMWDHYGGEGVWGPRFSRPFNDWEVERLLLIIRGKRLNPLLEDCLLWKETKDGIFSVKSLYAFWGKVLTLDQLKKRGRCLANRCFLCCEEEESIDHILIQCSKARVLWELLFALFGVTWVLPYSVRDTLSGWSGFNMGKKRRKVWKAAPSCIFWTVWKERNRIAFDNEELSMNRC
ncbi:hypothetical protein CK203_076318 [Vitis vinifera]|uniref:Reverse transcriptase domain-containing protein n=1 Tax=Vitis vinifera TaxID=29760 RepID=A0A438E5L9_VITVI|nr:hypothetical protein CK203_076318 [Vitis vinifera]